MEDSKHKRWQSGEVETMLGIIKDKHMVGLIDGKNRRNKSIYLEIEKEMALQNFHKSADQIRTKFKTLKADYIKVKRQNFVNGNNRFKCDYYVLLEEIWQYSPIYTISELDPPFSYGYISKPKVEVGASSSDDKIATPTTPTTLTTIPETRISTPPATTSPTPTATTSSTPTATPTAPSVRPFKNAQKRSYQTTIASFTDELKMMQNQMIKCIKDEEEELLEKLKENDEKYMKQLEVILEKDRQESLKAFKELLNSVQSSNVK